MCCSVYGVTTAVDIRLEKRLVLHQRTHAVNPFKPMIPENRRPRRANKVKRIEEQKENPRKNFDEKISRKKLFREGKIYQRSKNREDGRGERR